MTTPTADWYPVPNNPNLEWWWDGQGWTGHSRPTSSTPPPPKTPKRKRENPLLIGCGLIALIVVFGFFVLLAVIAAAIETDEDAFVEVMSTTTTSQPASSTTTASSSTSTTSTTSTSTTSSTAKPTSTTTTIVPNPAMSLSDGLEFIRDQVRLTPGVPNEYKQPFADALEGKNVLIEGISREYCDAASDAEDVEDFGSFLQSTSMRAVMQGQAKDLGLGEDEASALLSSFSTSVIIAYCPNDFERLFDLPAR